MVKICLTFIVLYSIYIDITNLIGANMKKKKKERAQLIANVDPVLKKDFQIALIQDDMSYTEWLLKNIEDYLRKRKK